MTNAILLLAGVFSTGLFIGAGITARSHDEAPGCFIVGGIGMCCVALLKLGMMLS